MTEVEAIDRGWSDIALYPAVPPSPQLYSPTPLGLAASPSSIAKAKPKESEPPAHWALRFYQSGEGLQDYRSHYINYVEESNDVGFTALEEIDRRREEAVQKYAQEVSQKQTWSALSAAAQYLSAGGSVATGVALAASSGTLLLAGNPYLAQLALTTGASLCLSSGLILTSRLVSDLTHTSYPKLETAALVASFALNCFASISLYQAGALSLVQNIPQVSNVLATIGTVLSASGKFMVARSEQRSAEIQALQTTLGDESLRAQKEEELRLSELGQADPLIKYYGDLADGIEQSH